MVKIIPPFALAAALAALALGGCHEASAPATAPTAAASAAAPAPVKKLSYNADIRPVLAENCFTCHGPDSGTRKARLRLDRAEFATAVRGDDPAAIVPGHPEKSPLVERIITTDAEDRMPPADSHKTLKPAEIAALRQWVAEGARYEEHWAFIAPVRPAVPPVAAPVRNPVDHFILARLAAEHLAPAPEADRATLLRRASYDLTGLPPSPAEAAAFFADPAPGAYERAVDRLLASPRWGEHRARIWLDAARYGDTQGLHLDSFRSIWPYRDYVIGAFNRNLPFDQFVREQLAGDLLPAQNLDQQLASAFVRAGISSGEGGTIVEELRVNNQRERTEMFGAVFLGLTTGCAACHDHKFDPLSQRDHYALSAFFNNLTENPSNDDRAEWPPFIRLPAAENRAAYDATLTQRAAILRDLDARRARTPALVAAWLAEKQNLPAPVSAAALRVRLRFDEQSGATVKNSAPAAATDEAPKDFTATGTAPAWGEDTWFWPSFRLETSTQLALPAVGDVEHTDAFSVGTWLMPRLETPASGSNKFGAIAARADATAGERGWVLWWGEGRVGLRLIHEWPLNALIVQTTKTFLTRGAWSHVLATYDGSGRAAGVRLYVEGEPAELEIVRDELDGSIRTSAPLHLGREHPEAFPMRQSRYQDFRFYARALPEAEARRVAFADRAAEIIARAPQPAWTEDEAKTVADFYLAHHDAPSLALAAQLPPLEAELTRLTAGGEVALVSAESPRLAYADVLTRGLYSQRAARVRPAPPHFLPPLPADAPRDRRGLAEWVLSPANPLTARVTVNRLWAEFFGTGLVETTEDFGTVGAQPSHPELLDWLAVEFREGGWDVKKLCRLLVTSATYRQSARATPALLERDPKNRLLARGPRFRLDAEALRDTALAASGLLVEKIGGPSVRPYQPEGVWENGGYPSSNTTHYLQDHGEALWRRSLYTFWKRMATMPNMDAFDAPVRDAACTRRARTNTPLQALVTMNDVQWLEAARALGQRVLLAGATDGERLDRLAQLLLARAWSPVEKAALTAALATFRATYAADFAAAHELVCVGESRPDPSIPATELAPWMLVASAALNLDATLNK